jgi:hypothetical protein
MADDLTEALAGPRQLKEPGSPAWCVQTVRYLKAHVRHVDEQWRQAEQVLDELVRAQAWRVIPPGKPYGTLNKMLKAEVGLDSRAIKNAIQGAELAARGANIQEGQKGFQRSDNITSLERGTSEAYTIRRLRRDRPDLAERVEHDGLSANAAAIEAGFRPKTVSVPITRPDAVARALLKYMTADDIAKLIAVLVGASDPSAHQGDRTT